MTRQRASLLLIILAAFWLRVWQLPQTPPGLWYDEAYYSMDAAWLLDGGPWRLFFAGNNGREPVFIYLQALFIWLWGSRPFTSRLLAPLVGTLTVPMVYVLARRLGRETRWPGWLPLLTAAGLALSYWHLGLSRGGFRGILLPLVTGLVFYTFWRGWRERSWRWLVLAGLALGFSQYTYLAARFLPLVLALFVLLQTLLHRHDRVGLKWLWLGLGVTGLVSAVVFAPLGWVFYQNPALFSARTGDVLFSPGGPAELLTHLADALRLFLDGGDPNWRHHLPGRPMLGWLGWLGFWPGLILCLRRLRRPAYLFLVVALLILFVPALLAVPPVHALRLSAVLPVYFVLFSLGLAELARRAAGRWWGGRKPLPRPVAAALLIILLLEGGLTGFDYFGRWAGREETYVEYNTPLVDLVDEVMAQTRQTAIIIPLPLYLHATTRYLLHDRFPERPAPKTLSGPVRLVTMLDRARIMSTVSIPDLPGWVWLERNEAGQGVAYVSRPPYPAEHVYLDNLVTVTPEIFRDRFNRDLAALRPVPEPDRVLPLFTGTAPARTAGGLIWAGQVRLEGYEVVPDVVPAGRPVMLHLHWRCLVDTTFDDQLFLQLLDGAGNPVSQWEGKIFHEDMYRWRPEGLLVTEHRLWLGPETPPGPYLVRLGFFDDRSGDRLPIQNLPAGPGAPAVDQVQLGLFYVSADGSDPRRPAIPHAITFGNTLKLTGVTLPTLQSGDPAEKSAPQPFLIHRSQFATQHSLPVTFYWQTLRPTDKPYTVFLQLLNEQGEVVSGWDSQPLAGLYPTSLWSPGEIVVDSFALPLPEGGLPPGVYRLVTGFYDFETGQRLPVTAGGTADWAGLAELSVEAP